MKNVIARGNNAKKTNQKTASGFLIAHFKRFTKGDI